MMSHRRCSTMSCFPARVLSLCGSIPQAVTASAASQIYTMLMDYKDDVTIKIDGIAASAASVIAMAGTKVLMAPTALIMIHNPMTMAYGNHADMEKAIEMLDEVKESIIQCLRDQDRHVPRKAGAPHGFGDLDECRKSHRAWLRG